MHELLLSVARRPSGKPPPRWRRAELALMECDDEPAQLRYANALTAWGDAGGYEAEVALGHLRGGRARRALRRLPVRAW